MVCEHRCLSFKVRAEKSVAPRGLKDGDRCIEGSVAACGTLVLVLSGLVCEPKRGRRDSDDEREMNACDASENLFRS